MAKKTTSKSSSRRSRPDLSKWDDQLPKNAAELNPNIPVPEAISDANRRLREAKRQLLQLSKLPTFERDTVDALAAAIPALEDAEDAWLASRRKERGAKLETVAKKAAAYESTVTNVARFIFRRDETMLARLDEISAGDGLADQLADLKALIPIVKSKEAAFEASRKTKGAVKKLAELHDALAAGSDSLPALQAQADRNVAFWRLDLLSREVYDALVFLVEELGLDADRVVNLRGYESRRKAVTRRKSAELKRVQAGG